MTALTACLQGALWLLSRIGLAALVVLAAALALALIALLIPFRADVSWEGEAEGAGPGRLTVRAGVPGLTFPVFAYPKPAPPPPGAEGERPGLFARARAKLKAKFAAWRRERRARRAAKAAARRPRPAAKPKQKAKLTLQTLCSLLRGAGRLTRAVFGALRVTHIRVFWPVGGGEPDEAARAYGIPAEYIDRDSREFSSETFDSMVKNAKDNVQHTVSSFAQQFSQGAGKENKTGGDAAQDRPAAPPRTESAASGTRPVNVQFPDGGSVDVRDDGDGYHEADIR